MAEAYNLLALGKQVVQAQGRQTCGMPLAHRGRDYGGLYHKLCASAVVTKMRMAAESSHESIDSCSRQIRKRQAQHALGGVGWAT